MKHANDYPIRRYRFTPYLPGRGPWFQLDVYDEQRTDERGAPVTGYRLTQRAKGEPDLVLFDGADHSGWHAIDSDETAESIMSFLTLRPGDTDIDYFRHYSEAQFAFCSEHAEALSMCVSDRWHDPETGGFNPASAKLARKREQRAARRAYLTNGGRS